jgi:hypothetical protein
MPKLHVFKKNYAKKTCCDRSAEANCLAEIWLDVSNDYQDVSGGSAVLGKTLRPVALRPCLSTGLPFSVQVINN